MALNSDQPVEILLVDDDQADVRLAQEGLQQGHSTAHLSTVADGVEALEFLRGHGRYAAARRPDLIILDLKMPRKSGLEVLAEIKADRKLRRIPVIVLTTSDAPEDILRAYDLNASCYITKPSDLDEFQRVMTTIRGFCLTVVKLPPRDPHLDEPATGSQASG
jgi:two-component system, chemotaxis family, response regulator Rcp1